MYVKPSNSTPSALRKARWEAAQKERNANTFGQVTEAMRRRERMEASWETPRP